MFLPFRNARFSMCLPPVSKTALLIAAPDVPLLRPAPRRSQSTSGKFNWFRAHLDNAYPLVVRCYCLALNNLPSDCPRYSIHLWVVTYLYCLFLVCISSCLDYKTLKLHQLVALPTLGTVWLVDDSRYYDHCESQT